ncbi:hypothetical protein ADUPG1_005940, partial [Aduncisulcus paluster]
MIVLVSSCPSYISTTLDNAICSATQCSPGYDDSTFWKYALMCIVIIIIQSAGLSFGDWIGYYMGARWRELLTNHFHELYFSSSKFYNSNNNDFIDNTDQRLASDIRLYCSFMCGSVEPTTNGVIFGVRGVICMFGYFVVPLLFLFKVGQTVMVLSCIVFFVFSFLLTWAANLPLPKPVAQQEKREGEFRFHHATVREGMESIAFYEGGNHEKEIADNLLLRAFLNMNRVIHRKLLSITNRWFFQSAIYWFPYTMFYLIYKKNDSCVDGQLFLTNTNYILNFVQSCSQLLNIGPGIAALGGISKRVSDMASVLGIFSNSSSSSSSSSSSGMGSSSAKGSKGKKKRFDVKEEKVPLLSEMTSEDLRYNGDEMGELGDISGASGRMSTA